jgi:hypothetical protein
MSKNERMQALPGIGRRTAAGLSRSEVHFMVSLLPADTLATFPYVMVRLGCTLCGRAGSYRLTRLADKYRAEVRMVDLLEMLADDCRYWGPTHPGIRGS